MLGDDLELPTARSELREASGPGFVLGAAAVAANFQMMNRLLDAIGGPVDPKLFELAAELGVELPAHVRGDLR